MEKNNKLESNSNNLWLINYKSSNKLV